VQTITIRGLNKEVLREYQVTGDGSSVGTWHWNKDYIYAGSRLLASESPTGTRHYHLDHLGTPRVITDANGNALAGSPYQYFPFGEEATATPPSDERLRFTGHERDHDYSGLSLDYMHARFYNQQGGKFLSVDPGQDFDPKKPQSWNLYSYVQNNPLGHTDPTGKAGATATVTPTISSTDPAQIKALDEGLAEVVRRLSDGKNPECLAFFDKTSNALANVLAVINKTTYSFKDLKNDHTGWTGAFTSSPKQVSINAKGPFMGLPTFPGQVAQIAWQFNVSGGQLEGLPIKAIILLHELGHQMDLIPHDGTKPGQSNENSRAIIKACFHEYTLKAQPKTP
jgi:RHS repeat-associated protein